MTNILKHPLNRNNAVERDFHSRLFSEAVFTGGFPAIYVQKSDFEKNITLGEWNREIFDKAYDVVVNVEGIQEFGNQSTSTKFSWEELDQSTLFMDDIQRLKLDLTLKIGDIVFFPTLNNKIFQITFVTNESKRCKYQYGVGYAWQMDVIKYALNLTDRFNSGNKDIDNLNNASLKTHENNNQLGIKQDKSQIYSAGNNPLLKD